MTSSSPAQRLFRTLARHAWVVLAVALVLAGASAWYGSRLSLLTSRKALLPADAPVAQRLERYLTRFGAASDLIVVLEQAPPETLGRFARQFAERLGRRPEIQGAVDRIDPQFFLEHGYLMAPPQQLAQLAVLLARPPAAEGVPAAEPEPATWDEALARAVRWAGAAPLPGASTVDLHSAEEGLRALLFFLAEAERWLDAPAAPTAIDWHVLLARYHAEALAQGTFVSRDGRMQFLFVRAAHSSEEFSVVAPFIAAVRQEGAALAAEWAAAGQTAPRLGLTGLPAVVFEEYSAIQHDILFVLITAALLIALLVLVALRSWRRALAVFVPMGLGVVYNLAATRLLVGHLTILTSGFTAILFGLGVNYGIFVSSRIMEELRVGAGGAPAAPAAGPGRAGWFRPAPELLVAAIADGAAASLRAVLVAGGATTVILLTLATAEFPGFAELGVVAASGVSLVVVATLLVQPALFALLPPRVPQAGPSAAAIPVVPRAGGSRSRSVLLLAGALAAAVAGGAAALAIPFDYDALELLPVGSEAAHYQRRMVAESDYQAEVVILTAGSIAQAREMAAQAATLPSVARVQAITDLFPPDAAPRAEQARLLAAAVQQSGLQQRLAALGPLTISPVSFASLRALLTQRRSKLEDGQEQAFGAGQRPLVALLEEALQRLDRLGTKLDRDPERGRQRVAALGQALVRTGADGLALLASWSAAAPLQPAVLPAALRDRFFAGDGTVAMYAFPAHSVYEPARLAELTREIYRICPEATGFPTTHEVFSRLVVRAFGHSTMLAGLAALLWLALLLRDPRAILLATLPLLLGGAWMMGLLWAWGRPFNFANIIALPLVMGLSIDYGVWFTHRWRELRERPAWEVARIAGVPILLAAGTTLAGLGAICLASYRGVSSMGLAITVGLLCCLAATLVIVPAAAELIGRKKP